MPPAPVQFEKHAPERRRRPAVATLHCGCSCCCCCCLHSIGGLIGAAVAPAYGPGRRASLGTYYDLDVEVPSIKRPALSAVGVFWWVFVFLNVIGLGLGLLADGGSSASIIITIVVLLLVMPALQLASALVTMLVIACWSRSDKSYQLVQLGKITLGLVLGTVLGIAAMAVVGVLLGALGR